MKVIDSELYKTLMQIYLERLMVKDAQKSIVQTGDGNLIDYDMMFEKTVNDVKRINKRKEKSRKLTSSLEHSKK